MGPENLGALHRDDWTKWTYEANTAINTLITLSFAERIDELGEVEIFDKRNVLMVPEHWQKLNEP